MVKTPNYDLDIDSTLGGSNASDYIIPSQKAIKEYVDNNSGGSPAWGNIRGTLSDQTDLQNALDAKANDADVVKLTGNQTVAGVKTFTNGIVSSSSVGVNNGSVVLRQGSNYYYFLDRTDLATSETTPDATKYEIMIARANNGDNLGQLMWYQTTWGDYAANLSVYRKVNGTEKSASLQVAISSSGVAFTYAPTPPTSDNSTQIATTANVDAKIAAQAVTLTGNQTITSTKQINDNSLFFKDTTHTRAGETTAAWQTNQILFIDKNGARVARIQPFYEPNGIQRITIAVDDGTEKSFNFFSNGALTLGALPSATNSKTDLWAATRGWVNDPALSTNVVHRDGDETIAGTKTFTGHIDSSYGAVYGSNSQIMGIQGFTSDGKLASLLQGWTLPNANTTGIYSFNPSGQYEGITVTIDSNGNVATYAPTPGTNDNSTKIATTAFVNNKLNSIPHITETYVNGTDWYRVWSDGWIEQGGYVTAYGSSGKTVNMLKSFSNTNYTIVGSCGGNDTNTQGYSPTFLNKTNSTFLWRTFNSGQGYDKNGSWYACGY